MSVIETLLVFVGIPALIVLVLFAGTYGRSLASAPNRYRVGRPWTFGDTWYVPHPELLASHPAEGPTTAVGGADGEW